MKYIPVIGLEIHAELKTESKMFCDCLNDPEEKEPNVNICSICLGHPGVLPVANNKAVEFVVKTGLSLNCSITEFSRFDRKNYFYPDLPKSYQISQLYAPFCAKGFLNVNGRKVRIKEIHLEEDTGKLTHSKEEKCSLIDFNRAGRPLMELVTEPDIASGEEARKFCEELRLIFRYLDISEANMEKGQMRCEVNISLKTDKKKMGTKVEIKNLNSFRAVERSVNYEIKRQAEVLDSEEKVVQETRGWDENKQKTFSQRVKEEANDYRYFPEPDLPPLNHMSEVSSKVSNEIPELPQAKRERFLNEYKLPQPTIETLVNSKKMADYFEQVISELKTWLKIKSIENKQNLVKLTANYLLTEMQRLLIDGGYGIKDHRVSPENFAEFITLIEQKEISSSAAQTVLKEMINTGGDPSNIIEDKNLKQVSDEDALLKIVKQIINDNPKPVNDFKKGKENALQFLVGRVMAASKGQANPEIARELLTKNLE